MSRLLLTLLLCCAAAACGGPAGDPYQTVVIYFGNQQLTLAELQDYFRANLLQIEDRGEGEGQSSDRVRSRLLDSFVEERLLLAEAERRGLKVENWEIEAYLALDEPDGGEKAERPGAMDRRELARRRLLVQMLREGTILGLPPLEDEEVKRYAERHGERLLSGRRLRLRALLLGSADEAEKVRSDIRRGRLTFDEAVAAYETYPGQGRSLVISWDSLSEEARSALDGLKPGRVSPPVEMQGSHYLFKVEAWLDEPEQIALERQERARMELQDRRRQQALGELYQELRERYPVRIVRRNLPFRYIPEDDE